MCTHACSLWIWSFHGQHVMKSTSDPCISYTMVNICTCKRRLVLPNGRVYRCLLAADPVLSRGNITWNRCNISAGNWLIYTNLSVRWLFSFYVYPYLSFVDPAFYGQYRIKLNWYRCRLYEMPNLYTCRFPLTIPMPYIPIHARCGSSPFEGQYHFKSAWYQFRSDKQVNRFTYRRPLIIPMRWIPILVHCGTGPFRKLYHLKSTWYQWTSYKLVNLYAYRRPLIILFQRTPIPARCGSGSYEGENSIKLVW